MQLSLACTECAALADASRGGPNSKGHGVQIVGRKGDLLIWHGWLQHSSSQRSADVEPYYPRLALLGSFRNTAMADSGPPVFYEPQATSAPPGSHRGVWKGKFREPPNRSELRYAIPPLDDLWHFWCVEKRYERYYSLFALNSTFEVILK